jgi:hypothetical protein
VYFIAGAERRGPAGMPRGETERDGEGGREGERKGESIHTAAAAGGGGSSSG